MKKLSALYVVLLFSCVFFACKKDEAPPSNSVAAGVDISMVAENLVSPVALAEAPDGRGRLFVVDQIGKIWIIEPDGQKMDYPFLDISSKLVTLMQPYDERGLLGLAFHPDYERNGKFYVFYTAPPREGGPDPSTPWDNLTRVSEFTVFASNTSLADINSEKVILELDHPQFNHNGGTIAFGPDGYLYISIGDGGGSDDNAPGHVADWYDVNAGGNAQNTEANLMGKILRIDVNSGSPYGIPADNPFVDKDGLDEIYAFGFRNPYRFSFDMGGTNQLLAGDAGQVLYEEIDDVVKGGNYGWNIKEGTHCFNTDDRTMERADCPDTDADGNPLIDPVIEINNHSNPAGGNATAIVGGHVYRGSAIPEMDGKYIFGVFSQDEDGGPNGKIFSAMPAASGMWDVEDLDPISTPDHLGMYLKGFGQDLDGEVYLLTTTQLGPTGNTGKVFKLIMGE